MNETEKKAFDIEGFHRALKHKLGEHYGRIAFSIYREFREKETPEKEEGKPEGPPNISIYDTSYL